MAYRQDYYCVVLGFIQFEASLFRHSLGYLIVRAIRGIEQSIIKLSSISMLGTINLYLSCPFLLKGY